MVFPGCREYYRKQKCIEGITGTSSSQHDDSRMEVYFYISKNEIWAPHVVSDKSVIAVSNKWISRKCVAWLFHQGILYAQRPVCVSHYIWFAMQPVFNGAVRIAIGTKTTGFMYSSQSRFSLSYDRKRQFIELLVYMTQKMTI